MNDSYFALHARKFYEAAKLGNSALAEWEAQLLIQPFIKQDEEAARRTSSTLSTPGRTDTTRLSGVFGRRTGNVPAYPRREFHR